jgi:hypothetical protein
VTSTPVRGAALQWTQSRDIAQDSDGGLNVVNDGYGNVYVIGATPLYAGGEDVVVIKYDQDGAELWMAVYDGIIVGGYNYPVDAVVDEAGNLYVTAESSTSGGNVSTEWVTFKLSAADGSQAWEQRYHGTGTFGFALPRDLAIGPDGGIVVTGWSRNDDTWVDFGAVKYTQDGSQRWARDFSSPGYKAESAEALAIGPDNRVVVVGRYVHEGDSVVGVVCYDAQGTFQWSSIYNAGDYFELEDNARSVVIDDAGNTYVAADGIDSATEGRDFVLLKYDPAGNLLWDRRATGPNSDIAPTVLLGPEGNIYVSGLSNGGYRLVAFDAEGNQLWSRQHGGAVTGDATPDHAAIDVHGHVAVLLRTAFVPGTSAFTIVRYDAEGTIVDQTTMDPQGVTRWPAGLDCDALGNCFATGNWIPSGNRDMLTYKVAYGAPTTLADLDSDGDVDLDDHAVFYLCMNGPGSGVDQACAAADLDSDGDVDFRDFGTFGKLLTEE